MITVTMKNVSHQKQWNKELVQVHIETPLTSLIKSKHDDTSDKDFVKVK